MDSESDYIPVLCVVCCVKPWSVREGRESVSHGRLCRMMWWQCTHPAYGRIGPTTYRGGGERAREREREGGREGGREREGGRVISMGAYGRIGPTTHIQRGGGERERRRESATCAIAYIYIGRAANTHTHTHTDTGHIIIPKGDIEHTHYITV